MPTLITPSAFLSFYDSRRVCQYLSDTGTPLNVGDLADNPVLADILAAASEEVESAVMVGERYTSDQLAVLSVATDTGFILRRLVADLAYSLIVSRRGQGAADIDRLCPRHREALRQLQLLATGVALFPGINEAQYEQAGLPSDVDLNNPNNPNRISTLVEKANRMFPWDWRRSQPWDCR